MVTCTSVGSWGAVAPASPRSWYLLPSVEADFEFGRSNGLRTGSDYWRLRLRRRSDKRREKAQVATDETEDHCLAEDRKPRCDRVLAGGHHPRVGGGE